VGNFLTNWWIINFSRRNVVESAQIRRGIFWEEIKPIITVIAIVLSAYNVKELGIRPTHKASPQR